MYLDKLISWLGSDSEAALFTSEVSKRYLTGFGSEDGVLIVTKRGAYLTPAILNIPSSR